MNKGKRKMIEVVKGYKLNEKELGCKYHKICYTCPFKDCIKGKKYVVPPAVPQAKNEQDCEVITEKGVKG